ncbi:MAG: IclR family transcriptional regulator [Sphingomonadales bacterium]|nr:MAG: IclR family transcriptional regulator [Sphingomonadales bacterium]
MPVKRIRGASRALEVLEAIARQQPVNVALLARHLGEDKSNLQRILMTLADDGWIRAAPGRPTRWELTARVYALTHMGQGHSELRHRARPALDLLRSQTGESVLLAIPDVERLVTIDVIESGHVLRAAPYIGMVIAPGESAAGQAVLAYMTPDQQARLLGRAPDAELAATLSEVRERGWSLNDGAVVHGSANIGAAILDPDGSPVAALVVSAPSERMPAADRPRIGLMLIDAVRRLSRVEQSFWSPD